MSTPLITEETSLVAGHVPKSTVAYLDDKLNWGWRNKLIIALCSTLELVWRDEQRDPELDSFEMVIERGLLAMAPTQSTRLAIHSYLHYAPEDNTLKWRGAPMWSRTVCGQYRVTYNPDQNNGLSWRARYDAGDAYEDLGFHPSREAAKAICQIHQDNKHNEDN